MPKLFQICVEGNTGSTGRMAESLGILALQQGWESFIAFGRFPRTSKSNLIQIESNWGIFLHGLQTRFFDRHCLGSKQATRKLIAQIKAIKPDIIHLHHLHGYYINIEVLFNFLAKASIPVVWTFHDCWSITGHCAHFDFIGCNKWMTECNHCPQTKEYPASFLIDRSRKNYRLKKELFTSVLSMRVVTVSNWLDGIVHNSFMRDIPRHVIYNGIDIDLFKNENYCNVKEKLEIVNRFMILGVSSPWGKRKGLNDFIELSKIIGKDDIIVLVGLDDAQIKDLPFNIIGITRTENQEQLKDLYATADVFLNLSVEETFGLTTAEALACGTPAVVYNATACPEVIDSETGIIVSKNDFKGLLDAIDTIKKKGKEYYSVKCRTRAVKNFNKNDRLQEYIDLYEKIM